MMELPWFCFLDPEEQASYLNHLHVNPDGTVQVSDFKSQSIDMWSGDMDSAYWLHCISDIAIWVVLSSSYINTLPLNNATIKYNYGVPVECLKKEKWVSVLDFHRTITPKIGKYKGCKLGVDRIGAGQYALYVI